MRDRAPAHIASLRPPVAPFLGDTRQHRRRFNRIRIEPSPPPPRTSARHRPCRGGPASETGLWFNDPNLPYRLGCEPNGPGTQPIVTPFNGEQHAGIQVLNTSEFPDGAGPLSHVHR